MITTKLTLESEIFLSDPFDPSYLKIYKYEICKPPALNNILNGWHRGKMKMNTTVEEMRNALVLATCVSIFP